jgi:hypothetical protein
MPELGDHMNLKCSVCGSENQVVVHNCPTHDPFSDAYCLGCSHNGAESIYTLLRLLQMDFERYSAKTWVTGYIDGAYLSMESVVKIYKTLCLNLVTSSIQSIATKTT